MPNIPRHILVTGGTGFVGQAVLRSLQADNLPLTYTYNRKPLEDLPDQGIQLDLSVSEAFTPHRERLADITDLVHTAAFVPDKTHKLTVLEDLHATVFQNIAITEHLLANLPNLQRIVFVSSCYATLNDPAIGFYGVGKRAVEDIIHQYAQIQGITSIALRFPQIYGPGETHGMYVNKFVRDLLAGGKVILDSNAASRKDLLYIGDVVESIKASLSLAGNSTITVSSDVSYSVEEIADKAVTATGVGQDRVIKAAAMAKQAPELHFSSDYKKYGLSLHYTLEAGLTETANYYRGKKHV